MRILLSYLKTGTIVWLMFSLFSCSPVVSTSLNNSGKDRIPVDEVMVLSVDQSFDQTGEKLGEVEFKSTEFNLSCEHEDALAKFKRIASKNGGNVIKITEEKNVNAFMEDCVYVRADIYYVSNLRELLEAKKSKEPDQEQNDEESEQVVIYIYRPPVMIGDLMEFDIYLDNEKLCHSKPNWGQKIILPKSGNYRIWTDTEKSYSLSLKLEAGKEYFISCYVSIGLRNSRPYLKLVEPSKGRSEYNKVVGQVIT